MNVDRRERQQSKSIERLKEERIVLDSNNWKGGDRGKQSEVSENRKPKSTEERSTT